MTIALRNKKSAEENRWRLPLKKHPETDDNNYSYLMFLLNLASVFVPFATR